MNITSRRILLIVSVWAFILIVYLVMFTGYHSKEDHEFVLKEDVTSGSTTVAENEDYLSSTFEHSSSRDQLGNHKQQTVGESTPPSHLDDLPPQMKTEQTERKKQRKHLEKIHEKTDSSFTILSDTFPLTKLNHNDIFIIGANSYVGYQVTKHLLTSNLNVNLRVSFDLPTDSEEFISRVRANDLKEVLDQELKRLDSHNLCQGWEKIRMWVKEVKYIVYTGESDVKCLGKLYSELTENHVLVVPRYWRDAYKHAMQSYKEHSSLELKEKKMSPILHDGITKGTVIELAHGTVIGELPSNDHIVSTLLKNLTTKSSITMRSYSDGSPFEDIYISSSFLSEAIYRAFIAVEKHRIVEKPDVSFLQRKHFSYNLHQPCRFTDKNIVESFSLFTELPFNDIVNTKVDVPKATLDVIEGCNTLGNCGESTICDAMLDKFSKWYMDYHYPNSFAMTTYLTSQGDPQRGRTRYRCEFSKMQEYYKSVHKVARTNSFPVFIFYDDCQPQFIRSYETQYIRFVKVDKEKFTRSSPNDERFAIFEQFLEGMKVTAPSENYVPTHVLWTDLFDVVINRNPFEFMENYELNNHGDTRKHFLYPGKDNDKPSSREWFLGRIKDCSWLPEYTPFLKAPLMNAGVCGGRFDSILSLIKKIKKELWSRESRKNCNMPAYNLVLNKYFSNDYFTGPPFTSPFFKFDHDPKYYIRHK